MTRTIVIWFCWVAAVLFFAWASYWAPGDSGDATAPEIFLALLGVIHLLGGAALTTMSLGDEADWLK